jgi:hypothetical protein
MKQDDRALRRYAVPRDADIATIVSLVTAIAALGFWRLVG